MGQKILILTVISIEENIPQNLTTRNTNINMDYEDLDIGGILGKNAENTTFEEERPSQLSNQNIQNNDDRRQSLVASSENLFPCENCDKQFSSSQGLSFHKKSVHFGIKYSCHLCNHKGTTQGNLNKHITSVHEGKRYPCNKCDYVAAQNEILKLHMKSIHEGERYPCNKCDYNAKRSSNLISHVKSIHEGH